MLSCPNRLRRHRFEPARAALLFEAATLRALMHRLGLEPAHRRREQRTGCVAFGIDRLALALFATHGLDLPRWPAAVRKALML